jgi:hypothetical protein
MAQPPSPKRPIKTEKTEKTEKTHIEMECKMGYAGAMGLT